MGVQENNLMKFCSFYVSEWHLITMLLPYINQKINEQAKIATILENNIEENVTTLLQKLNLKNKEKIQNINWNKEERKNIFSNLNESNKEIIIIVNGKNEFIKSKNEKIEKYLKTHKINQKIKIINCYELIEFNGSITEILDEHDKILNTSGEKEITDVFEDYEKESKQESKLAI